MRLPLLLILLFGISFAAPITINHEAAARMFYWNFSVNYTKMNNGGVADLVFEQFEKFFPAFISAEDKKVIKDAFVDYRNKEDMKNSPSFTFDPAIVGRASAELNKRIAKLDTEAQSFMKTVINDLSVGGLFNMSLVSAKFTRLRTMYDPPEWEVRRLTPSAKASLAGQFEVFNRLDEAQALITIGDRLFDLLKTGCSDVPEFRECKKLKNKGLIFYEEASSNHEGAARKSLSQFVDILADYGLSETGKLEAVFDLLWEKFDKYFPGIVSAEDKIPIKAAFLKDNEEDDWARKLGAKTDPFSNVDSAVAKRVEDRFMNKLLKLNGEALAFIEKAFDDARAGGCSNPHQFVTKFTDFHTKYDASTASVKSSLSAQFEFFNRLDEIQALLSVGERILATAIDMCDNLSESGQCGQTK